MKRFDPLAYVPVGGAELLRLWKILTVGGGAALVAGQITYWVGFWSAYSTLFDPSGEVIGGRVMTGFWTLARGQQLCHGAVMLLQLALIPLFYGYHYRGSRSVYLMRRLPQRWELVRRCLMLPL